MYGTSLNIAFDKEIKVLFLCPLPLWYAHLLQHMLIMALDIINPIRIQILLPFQWINRFTAVSMAVVAKSSKFIFLHISIQQIKINIYSVHRNGNLAFLLSACVCVCVGEKMLRETEFFLLTYWFNIYHYERYFLESFHTFHLKVIFADHSTSFDYGISNFLYWKIHTQTAIEMLRFAGPNRMTFSNRFIMFTNILISRNDNRCKHLVKLWLHYGDQHSVLDVQCIVCEDWRAMQQQLLTIINTILCSFMVIYLNASSSICLAHIIHSFYVLSVVSASRTKDVCHWVSAHTHTCTDSIVREISISMCCQDIVLYTYYCICKWRHHNHSLSCHQSLDCFNFREAKMTHSSRYRIHRQVTIHRSHAAPFDTIPSR